MDSVVPSSQPPAIASSLPSLRVSTLHLSPSLLLSLSILRFTSPAHLFSLPILLHLSPAHSSLPLPTSRCSSLVSGSPPNIALSPQICSACVRCKSCGATPGKNWDVEWSGDYSLCPRCTQLFEKGGDLAGDRGPGGHRGVGQVSRQAFGRDSLC